MKQVSVDLGRRSYPITIGTDLLSHSQTFSPYLSSDQVFIITNPTVAELYLQPIQQALSGYETRVFEMGDGESFKSFATFEAIIEAMIKAHCRRNTTVIALGGGVVGDMAGFAAACYQRGIPFIQVPTTLLAMVDSSVGGKTAINHPLAKNMVGAFYQPQAVVADLNSLNSLPTREFWAGMAEVVKYGFIYDVEFLQFLEAHIAAIHQRDHKVLAMVVERCCEIKAEVVKQDERELGLRAILNLGHTFGHAIEKAGNYQQYLHGEAVAIGSCMAFELALAKGLIDKDYFQYAIHLFKALELPTELSRNYSVDDLLSTMRHDKKNQSARVRLVIPVAPGKVEISDQFSDSEIKQAIRARIQ
jgi:3-dehydroquinate synthase